jgi:hypothetical protein
MFKKRTLLDHLRKQSLFLDELPSLIYVDGTEVALEEATLDQVAFAILEMEEGLRPISRRVSALRELVEQARKRRGLGAQRLDEIFSDEEARP